MISEKTLNIIEYRKIMRRAAEFAASLPAKTMLEKYTPADSYDKAADLLNLSDDAFYMLYILNTDPINSFDDITDAVYKSETGATLSISELMAVASLLRASRLLKRSIYTVEEGRIQHLKALVSDIFYSTDLEEAIFDSFISDTEVSDNASDELRSIRRSIAAVRENIRKRLNSMLSEYSAYLQDSLITVRSGRFVLPIRSEHKNSVNGLLHDRSSSGSTLFIEPIAVVEMNNNLRELQLREQEEIARILQHLSNETAKVAAALIVNQQACLDADILFAKIRFCDSIRAKRAELTDDSSLILIDARHPLIDPKLVVPISVSLTRDKRILLISGPNTGGKTVTLKTAGLFAAMIASGMYLPCADGTRVSFYKEIFCDIGDDQNIELSLSTFSSHIKNIVGITDGATQRSLILLDELGGGTDPVEGSALAIGILEFLRDRGSSVILTTHYSTLKEYAISSGYIKSASMQFDKHTLLPTFKILLDVPGTSNALAIAEHYGIDKSIITRAKENIGDEKRAFDELLRLAESTKSQAEEELHRISLQRAQMESDLKKIAEDKAKIAEQRERLTMNAKAEVKRLISGAVAESNDLIEQIRGKIEEADEKKLLEAKMLRSRLKGLDVDNEDEEKLIIPLTRQEMTVGNRVYVIPLKKDGVISTVKSKAECGVSIGGMTTYMRLENLAKFIEPLPEPKIKQPKREPVKTSSAVEEIAPAKAAEVYLLGYTVQEAIIKMDEIIGQAKLDRVSTIRVIHGKGTGALMSGLHEYFHRRRQDIASFRLGNLSEGGSGATILTLK